MHPWNDRVPTSWVVLAMLGGLVQGAKAREAASPAAPRWIDASCGCVRPDLEGTVFRVLSWNPTDSTERTVDFGVSSRIEIQGLSFDDSGILTEIDAADRAADFVARAREHGSAVDWVVARSDWRGWVSLSRERRLAAQRALARGIAEFLARPLPDAGSRIGATLPLPGRPRATWGDGVTLRFVEHPSGPEERARFVEFVKDLDGRLKAADPGLHLNLMFPRADLESAESIHEFGALMDFLKLRATAGLDLGEGSTHLLVLMGQPTSREWQELSSGMDRSVQGSERRTMARALVPVHSVEDGNWQRLALDIERGRENFGGFGILPMGSEVPDKGLSRVIEEAFAGKGGPLPRPRWLDAVVCAHRWTFRTALFASLALALIAGGAALLHAPSRRRFARHPLAVSVCLAFPSVLIAILLLGFDPGFGALAGGRLWHAAISLFVIALIALVVVGIRRLRRASISG